MSSQRITWIDLDHFNDGGLRWLAEVNADSIARLAKSNSQGRQDAKSFTLAFDAANSVEERRKVLSSDRGAHLARIERALARTHSDDLRKLMLESMPSGEQNGSPTRRQIDDLLTTAEASRATATETRRRLGKRIMTAGAILLLLNVIVVPLLAVLFNWLAATPLRTEIASLEQEMKRFEAETKLAQRSGEIESLDGDLRALDEDLSKLIGYARGYKSLLGSDTSSRGFADSTQDEGMSIPARMLDEVREIGRRWERESTEVVGRRVEDDNAELDEEEEDEEDSAAALNSRSLALLDGIATLVAEQIPAVKEGESAPPVASPLGYVVYPEPLDRASSLAEAYSAVRKRRAESKDATSESWSLRREIDRFTDNNWKSRLRVGAVEQAISFDLATIETLQGIADENSRLQTLQNSVESLDAEYARFTEATIKLLSESFDEAAPTIPSTDSADANADSPTGAAPDDTPSFRERLASAMVSMKSLSEIGEDYTELQDAIPAAIKRVEDGVTLRDSITSLIRPYAYVVLALAAMFLTIGLQMLIKLSRGADDELRDAQANWRRAALLDQAALWQSAGADATPFVLAAVDGAAPTSTGESESLLPSPVMKTAKEGAEIARAVNR